RAVHRRAAQRRAATCRHRACCDAAQAGRAWRGCETRETEKRMSGLLVTRDGGLARLTLDRPEALNGLDIGAAVRFLAACRELQHDRSVRAVLIAGNGRAFAAGGDLAQLRADPVAAASALIGPLHEALTILASLDAPVIAALHGAVAGAGLSLAAAADL